MIELERSALLMCPAEQMYALINDVEAYPEYMDGCESATILEHTDETMVARLSLHRSGLHHSFITRNRLFPPERVELTLEEGPFEFFEGQWRVQPLRADACKVSLQLRFRLKSGLLDVAAKGLFNNVANHLVDAMVKRAKKEQGQ